MALVFGMAVVAGLVPQRKGAVAPHGSAPGWAARLDRRLTVRFAALAGPLTHIPGVFYLVALNVIVAHNPALPGGIVAVAVYDGLWFAVPIAALAMSIVDPASARALVGSVQSWTAGHSREVVIGACFLVGSALVVRGLLAV